MKNPIIALFKEIVRMRAEHYVKIKKSSHLYGMTEYESFQTEIMMILSIILFFIICIILILKLLLLI